MLKVGCEHLDSTSLGSQISPSVNDSDHSFFLSDRADFRVVEIAPEGIGRIDACVADDHGPSRELCGIEKGLSGDMGEVDHHATAVHLLKDGATKVG
jgi:hypothetical protein